MTDYTRREQIKWLTRRLGGKFLPVLACMTDAEVTEWVQREAERPETGSEAGETHELTAELAKLAAELLL